MTEDPPESAPEPALGGRGAADEELAAETCSLEATPPLVPVPTRIERQRSERLAAGASWRRLRSAMTLFLLLLAINVANVVYVRCTGDTSPRVDLVATVVDAAIVLAFCGALRTELRALLRPSAITGRHLLLAFTVLFGIGVVVEAWFFALHGWFEEYQYLADYRTHGWPFWSALVLIALCPAVFEELAFRGYLMHQVETVLDRGEILLLQAALFAIAHCSVVVLPSHFVMGLGLGWLRQRTGSLLPGMLVHACWNAWVLAEQGLLRGAG